MFLMFQQAPSKNRKFNEALYDRNTMICKDCHRTLDYSQWKMKKKTFIQNFLKFNFLIE